MKILFTEQPISLSLSLTPDITFEKSRSIHLTATYLPHLHLVPPLVVIPSEFRRDLLHHNSRVHGLSCEILCLAVLIYY